MTRRKLIENYPLRIYVNGQRHPIHLRLEAKDGHWTATFQDLKAMGTYSEAIFGIRDQVVAVINHQITLQQMEQVRDTVNA